MQKEIYNRTLEVGEKIGELEGIATKLDSKRTGRGEAGCPPLKLLTGHTALWPQPWD